MILNEADITNKLIYVLVLNYNCAEETIKCCESILCNVKYSNYHILIIDNNSSDNSSIALQAFINDYDKGKDKLHFYQSENNYGYASGNNIGIKYALREGAEYICIINPDVIAIDDFLSELVDLMEHDNNIGMTGPAVCDSTDNNKCIVCGANIGKMTAYSRKLNYGLRLDQHNELYECDYLEGMCILIRSDVISKIGMIPENYFLFYEETEWCIKCGNAGYKCVADANAKVIHYGSVTVDKASAGNERLNLHNYYLYRNRIVFQKRMRSKLVYSVFLAYYFAEIVYERIKRHYTKDVWIAYLDGILNKDRLNHIKMEHK